MVKAVGEKLRADLHRVRRRIAVLEHARIVDDPHVNRLCDVCIDQALIHKLINKLRGGAGVGLTVVDLTAAGSVADMMVDIDRLFRRFKIFFRSAQTAALRIQRDAHVVNDLFGAVRFDLVNAPDARKYRRRAFQINIDHRFGQRFFQIQIQPHAGTDAVSVRAHMSADCDEAVILHFLQNFLHPHPPLSSRADPP